MQANEFRKATILLEKKIGEKLAHKIRRQLKQHEKNTTHMRQEKLQSIHKSFDK